MFRKKTPAARDGLIEEVRVVRFTRGAMKEIMDGAGPSGRFTDAYYDAAVKPYNWIDVAAGCAGAALSESGAELDGGAAVRQVLVDSRAVAEMGYAGRPLYEVSTDAWRRGVGRPDPETEERIRAAGLNISEWDYALSLNMVPEEGDHDARLPDGTREAISEYLEGVAGAGFTVHVGKYMVDTGTYLRDLNRFEEMARESLSGGREIGYSAYGVLKARGARAIRLCVPVTVRETHEPSAITGEELLRYMHPEDGAPDREHFGRFLWMMNPGLGPDGETRMADFSSSEAGKLLAESVKPLMACEAPWHFTLQPASLAEVTERLMDIKAGGGDARRRARLRGTERRR